MYVDDQSVEVVYYTWTLIHNIFSDYNQPTIQFGNICSLVKKIYNINNSTIRLVNLRKLHI